MIELSKDYYDPQDMKCEIWRDIYGFKCYKLSNHGRVKRTDRITMLTPDIRENKNGTTTYYFKLYQDGKRYTYNLMYLMIQAGFEPDTEPPQERKLDLVYNKNDEFAYKAF